MPNILQILAVNLPLILTVSSFSFDRISINKEYEIRSIQPACPSAKYVVSAQSKPKQPRSDRNRSGFHR